MKITESQLRSIIRETIINESMIGDLGNIARPLLTYFGNKLVNFAGKDELELAYEIFKKLKGVKGQEAISELDEILREHSLESSEKLDEIIALYSERAQLFSDVVKNLELYKNDKFAGQFQAITKPKWMN